MKVMKCIVSFISTINEKLGLIVSFLFLPITFIAVFEVIMRYVFNSPTIWAWDMNMQFFAPLVMLSGGYVLLHNGHVAVDVFVIDLSPRKRAILDLCTSIIFFIAMFVILFKGAQIGLRSFMRGETVSSLWGPPLWTIKLWVPIGIFFVLIQGIAKFITDLQTAFMDSEAKEGGIK